MTGVIRDRIVMMDQTRESVHSVSSSASKMS